MSGRLSCTITKYVLLCATSNIKVKSLLFLCGGEVGEGGEEVFKHYFSRCVIRRTLHWSSTVVCVSFTHRERYVTFDQARRGAVQAENVCRNHSTGYSSWQKRLLLPL